MKRLIFLCLFVLLVLPTMAETTYDGPTFTYGNTWSVMITDDRERRIYFAFSDEHSIDVAGMSVTKDQWSYLVKTYRAAQKKFKENSVSPGSTTSVRIDTPRGYMDGTTIYFSVANDRRAGKAIIVNAMPESSTFQFKINASNSARFEKFITATSQWFATIVNPHI